MKKLLFALMILPVVGYGQRIEGVVTCRINDDYEYKPDLGANVYVIKLENKSDSNNFENIKKTTSLIFWWQMYHLSMDRYSKVSEDMRKSELKVMHDAFDECKKYGVSNDYEFSLKCDTAHSLVNHFRNSSKSVNLLIDGVGRYFIDVEEGNYIIIIQSKGRQRANSLEYNGQIYVDIEKLEKGQVVQVNKQFEL